VWEFDAHVASSVAKSRLEAHTAMTWSEFEREVLKRLDGAVMPVQLAYRISGDTGMMSYLKDDADWADAIRRLEAKIPLTRKHAVSIDIRNLVSFITTTYQDMG